MYVMLRLEQMFNTRVQNVSAMLSHTVSVTHGESKSCVTHKAVISHCFLYFFDYEETN